MKEIKLLDCTLRDGGYINDWHFGKKAIDGTIELLEESNVDILELGFLKDEPYNQNRTVFNDMNQISDLILPKKDNVKYAAMKICELRGISMDELLTAVDHNYTNLFGEWNDLSNIY